LSHSPTRTSLYAAGFNPANTRSLSEVTVVYATDRKTNQASAGEHARRVDSGLARGRACASEQRSTIPRMYPAAGSLTCAVLSGEKYLFSSPPANLTRRHYHGYRGRDARNGLGDDGIAIIAGRTSNCGTWSSESRGNRNLRYPAFRLRDCA